MDYEKLQRRNIELVLENDKLKEEIKVIKEKYEDLINFIKLTEYNYLWNLKENDELTDK